MTAAFIRTVRSCVSPAIWAAIAVAIALFIPTVVHAQGGGDLLVSPTRVIFEDRDRSISVSLSNRGAATATFRISIINMEMDENGDLKELASPVPGAKTAEEMIRYAPRQVVIEPGGSQVVRLSLRKPADLGNGEYRSHMFFRAIPPEDAGQSVAASGTQSNELQIRLIPIYGITIPLIVRHGKLESAVQISGLALADLPNGEGRVIKATLTRSGTESSFGDVTVRFKPAAGGEPVIVGQVTRLAVYTPNTTRNIQVPLRVPDGVNLANGTLDITYQAPSDEGGALLAEASIPLR
jgi:P pilus assembly chaperone PapD